MAATHSDAPVLSGTMAAGRPVATWKDGTLRPRWRGQPDRLEAWYCTFTDPETGVGFWAHVELVAKKHHDSLGTIHTSNDEYSPHLEDGENDPFAVVHGWVAVFFPGEPARLERIGPAIARSEPPGAGSSDAGSSGAGSSRGTGAEPTLVLPPGTDLRPGSWSGEAGGIAWNLSWHEGGETLWTFPRWTWEREILPGAQCVPEPSARFSGTIMAGERSLSLNDAPGAIAHIYGHGSAKTWAWLHANLSADDVIEVVTAVSRTPGLDRMSPLAFVQLRFAGRDWPRDPLVAAPLFRSRIGLPEWGLRGTIGRRRLTVDVTIPVEEAVSVGYPDPDGSTATCTNCEISDAVIVLERRRSRWEIEYRWHCQGNAHAEVGTRP